MSNDYNSEKSNQSKSDENKIYVGNIPYDADSDTLKDHFSGCGEVVDAIVISDRETKRSKGFGFVTFADKDGLDAALKKDHSLDDRALKVNKAEARKPR